MVAEMSYNDATYMQENSQIFHFDASRQQSCMEAREDLSIEVGAVDFHFRSPQRMESHQSLDQVLLNQYNEKVNQSSRMVETIREIGDGLTAKIYLAKDRDNRNICVKVFKRNVDYSLMNSPEEEYRVS